MTKQTDGWRILAASVAGTSHQVKDTPCQDASAYRFVDDNVIVLAVADGAGSAPRSAEGSEAAVSAIVDFIAAELDGERPTSDSAWQALIQRGFERAMQSLSDYAAEEGIDAQALATTLTCVVATDQGLTVGLLGDGFVVCEDHEAAFATVAPPVESEYANEVVFLTSSRARDSLQLTSVPYPARTIIMSTDGLLPLTLELPSYAPFEPFLRPVASFIEQADDIEIARRQLAEFLQSDRVNARTDDDKTLLVAQRLAGTISVPADEATAAPNLSAAGPSRADDVTSSLDSEDEAMDPRGAPVAIDARSESS